MTEWIEDVARRLNIIQGMCSVSHASLWLVRNEAIELVAGQLTLPVSRAIQSIWLHCAFELREGRTIEEEGFTFVPLQARVQLTGLLVLSGQLPNDDLDRPYIETLLPRLGVLLGRDPTDSRRPLSLTVGLADLARPTRRRKLNREAVESLLEHVHGNISEAARCLSVTRQTMYNILNRLAIPIRDPRRRA
jgi:Bacterial regulatory protein, Fis family